MEVGQHVYQAGWGWLMQPGSVPFDQKIFCKWNLSFFKVLSPNRLPLYLGSPLCIISSLFSQFYLFQNAILCKHLKLRFWNVKPIFHRMQFSLVATFFSLVLVISLSWVCILNCLHELYLYHLTSGDKSISVLGLHIWN